MVMNVDLYISDNEGNMQMFYRFINPRLNITKNNGVMSMPIPATGDAPMLMNTSGMKEYIEIEFSIINRADYCGVNSSFTFPDGVSKVVNNNGIYSYEPDISNNTINTNSLSLNLNKMFSQYYYLKDWLVTGTIGTMYSLVIYDKDSGSASTSTTYIEIDGIPSDLRMRWVGGEMSIEGSFKFLVGMVIA